MLALAPESKVLQIIVRGSQSDGTVRDLGVIVILELQIESDKSMYSSTPEKIISL